MAEMGYPSFSALLAVWSEFVTFDFPFPTNGATERNSVTLPLDRSKKSLLVLVVHEYVGIKSSNLLLYSNQEKKGG